MSRKFASAGAGDLNGRGSGGETGSQAHCGLTKGTPGSEPAAHLLPGPAEGLGPVAFVLCRQKVQKSAVVASSSGCMDSGLLMVVCKGAGTSGTSRGQSGMGTVLAHL